MTENTDFAFSDNSSTGDPILLEKVATETRKKKPGTSDIKPEVKLTIYNNVKCLIENGHWNHRQAKRIKEDFQEFNVSKSTVRIIVRQVKVDIAHGVREIPDFTPKKKGNCGRKNTWTTPQITARLESAPVELRGSSRDSAAVVGCSHTTIL